MRKISVKVVTNSKKNCVEAIGESFVVRTTAKPVDGEANEKVITLLSDHLNLPKSEMAISKGKNNKHKIIEIND